MTTPETPRSVPDFGSTVFLGAVLGFAFGFLHPATQVAIEPAQVLTGIVSYPTDNAFWLYETRLWTVLHQLLALLLRAGVGERTLSQLLSGGAGALNFAALAAFARALGGGRFFAVIAGFLFWALHPVSWGWGYPILLVGHPHTYGTYGLAWAVLACSAIGAGRSFWGAAMLGFAPAIHPTVGAFTAATTGIAALLGWRSLAEQRSALMRGAALGVAGTAASLVLQRWMEPAAPPPDVAAIDRLFPVFLREWDAHRQPFLVTFAHVWMLALGAAVAIAWLRRGLAAAQALLLRTLLVVVALGIVFALVNQSVPLASLPRWVQSAMAIRSLNFAVLTFLPLLVAALTQPGASWLGLGGVALLGAIALFRQYVPGLDTWGLAAVAVAALVATALGRRATDEVADPRRARAFEALAVLLSIGVANALYWSERSYPQRVAADLRDRTSDRALAAAADGHGLLAVAPGVERAQLATRRPIVIDPQALDMVAYVPAGLPALARAVDDLYGIDFGAPLAADAHLSVLPEGTVQAIWERRTPSEWIAVAREFDAHDVLTPASWHLQLPEVARSPVFALYRVDEPAP